MVRVVEKYMYVEIWHGMEGFCLAIEKILRGIVEGDSLTTSVCCIPDPSVCVAQRSKVGVWPQQMSVSLQNKVQLCCTIYQCFLHAEAVCWLCMPANECSKDRGLFATGQVFNSSPNHDHTHMQHVFRQANFACHYTLLCSSGLLFFKSHSWLGTSLKTLFQTAAPRAYPTFYSTNGLNFLMLARITTCFTWTIWNYSVKQRVILNPMCRRSWYTLKTYGCDLGCRNVWNMTMRWGKRAESFGIWMSDGQMMDNFGENII